MQIILFVSKIAIAPAIYNSAKIIVKIIELMIESLVNNNPIISEIARRIRIFCHAENLYKKS